MKSDQINRQVILDINKGKEPAFAILYNHYFTYLCVYATTYLYNPVEAEEVVNDVFVHVWQQRAELDYPIHAYLMRSVKNGCLNQIRSLRMRESALDEYRQELLQMQEDFCMTDDTPLQKMEVDELQKRIERIADSFPDRCRMIFDRYFYKGTPANEIAEELGISPTTVRVQIKNAMDRMRLELGTNVVFFLLILHRITR